MFIRLFRMLCKPFDFIVFLVRNIWCSRHINRLPIAYFKEFVVGPLANNEIQSVASLYKMINDGKELPASKITLLQILGTRLCVVARNEEGSIKALSLYYFNGRDTEKTIHEGFTGLMAQYRGCGLGTFIRRHALSHFSSNGMLAVSSRISVSNTASFESNKNLGFVPIEKYYDNFTGEERYYLICNLEHFKCTH
jgi:hypothetical protein